MCKTDIHKPEIVQRRYNLSLPGRTEYTKRLQSYTKQDKSLAYKVKLWSQEHSFLSNISALRKTYRRCSMFIMAFNTPTSLLEAQFYTIWLKVYV